MQSGLQRARHVHDQLRAAARGLAPRAELDLGCGDRHIEANPQTDRTCEHHKLVVGGADRSDDRRQTGRARQWDKDGNAVGLDIDVRDLAVGAGGEHAIAEDILDLDGGAPVRSQRHRRSLPLTIEIGCDHHRTVVITTAPLPGVHAGPCRHVRGGHRIARVVHVLEAQPIEQGDEPVSGRRHVEVVLLRDCVERTPRHAQRKLFARPAIERGAVGHESLLIARIMQRDARPKGEPAQAGLEQAQPLRLVERLHAPLVVVVAKVPHGVLVATGQGIVRV
eukprot:21426-Prymnesium_polylepis.2